jgi:hypothetical protein
MTETIARAAIQARDGQVWSVPRPGRHHDVIALMAERPGHDPRDCSPERQGFTTSTGRFVGRVEGMQIAKAAGQVINKPHAPMRLFSEDLF